MVIDPQKLFLESFSSWLKLRFPSSEILSSSLGVIGVEFIASRDIDLNFLDLNTADLRYDRLLELIVNRNQRSIVITNCVSRERIFNALRIGIDGFLHKNDDLTQLISCMNSVMKGQKHYNMFCKELTLKNVEHFNLTAIPLFSSSEMELLSLLRRGYTIAEMANVLELTTSAIGKKLVKLYKKTNKKNMLELTLYVIDNELVNL